MIVFSSGCRDAVLAPFRMHRIHINVNNNNQMRAKKEAVAADVNSFKKKNAGNEIERILMGLSDNQAR
jgi:hypothetical protein